jgi:hypothetical protein
MPLAVRALVLVALTLFVMPQALHAAEPAPKAKLLRHVVLFQFKADVSKAQVQEVVEAFRKLPGKIKEIAAFEWGTDVGVENLANGFTHCFLVTFKSEKDRDAYLPHAAHKEFVDLVKPRVEKVQVIDYWTQE